MDDLEWIEIVMEALDRRYRCRLATMSASYYGEIKAGDALVVTEEFQHCHPMHTHYPLLPGDLLVPQEDGTFYKHGPGLGIVGFILSQEQQASLQPCKDTVFGIGGMDYFLGEEF